MSTLLTEAFLSTLIFGAVTAGVPLLLAGLGEQISEKAGVLNIGIEGMMLAGAYGGFVAAYVSDSFAVGFLAGAVAGMAVASLMAIFCIRLSLNQIVVGIALTLVAEGLTALLHFFQFSRTYPRLPKAPVLAIPGLDSIPVVGPGLFRHNVVVYLAALLVAAIAWLFRKTYIGLNLEAAGSRPAALDAAGIDVRCDKNRRRADYGSSGRAWGRLHGRGRRRVIRPLHDERCGLHCDRPGHVGEGTAAMGPARRTAFRRQLVAHDGAASRRHRHADGCRPNAAVRDGHHGARGLRAQQHAAAGAWPALHPRRALSQTGGTHAKRFQIGGSHG